MTLKELETRVAELEKTVAELKAQVANGKAMNGQEPWWISQAGHFANDPVFDEIVRLGREYRESLHPDYQKKKNAKKKGGKKKTMLVLDTDLLTLIQRAASVEYHRLISRLPANDPLSVHLTIVSFEEQMRGWLTYVAKARTKDRQVEAYGRLHTLLRDFGQRQVLDFDAAAAEQLERLVKAKVRIGTMDLRIAAIALANNAKLLSRNLSHFRKVPGLQVEDWTLP